MYRIVLLPLAGKDIRMAMKWYEDKSYELGQKFREEVFLQIDKLKNDFIERSSVFEGLSCVFLKRFPYVIYYQKNPVSGVITVFAILNQKQDRNILRTRV